MIDKITIKRTSTSTDAAWVACMDAISRDYFIRAIVKIDQAEFTKLDYGAECSVTFHYDRSIVEGLFNGEYPKYSA